MLVEAIDVALQPLSDALGFQLDQLKYVFCLLLSYPIGLLYRAVLLRQQGKGAVVAKHLYGIAFGLLGGYICYGAGLLHSFVSSTVCYLMMRFMPHGVAHIAVFVFSMAYIAGSHIYRQYTDYMGWSMDFTTSQMMLTIKLTSLAMDYYDGSRPTEELSEHQKKHAIKKLPSLLEFYGFVYTFFSFLAGPVIDMKTYLSFTDLSMFKAENGKVSIPPFPFSALLIRVSYAIICMVGYIVGGIYVPVSGLYTDAFFNSSFLFRVAYIVISIPCVRFKYYFGWFLAEGACIATGISWNGIDEKTKQHKWDRVTNVYWFKVELAENVKGAVDNWNIATQNWLKHYVYLRLTPAGTKPKFSATLITYTMSAFWHGFYPGYYMFFIYGAVVTSIARTVRHHVRPLFLTKDGKKGTALKPLYDIAGIITTSVLLSYAGVSFMLLELEGSLRVYNSLYWFGHVILAVAFVGQYAIGFFMKKPRRSSSRNDAGAPDKGKDSTTTTTIAFATQQQFEGGVANVNDKKNQ